MPTVIEGMMNPFIRHFMINFTEMK